MRHTTQANTFSYTLSHNILQFQIKYIVEGMQFKIERRRYIVFIYLYKYFSFEYIKLFCIQKYEAYFPRNLKMFLVPLPFIYSIEIFHFKLMHHCIAHITILLLLSHNEQKAFSV